MAKDKGLYKTATQDNENPYRKGTAKRMLMQWALDNAPFTREQFEAECVRLKNDPEGFKSVQSDAVIGKAWWGELCTKAEVIVPVE